MFDQIPPELRSASPGIAGAALALFFMKRTPFVMAGIFVGGCIVSYYVTPWLVHTLEMDKGRDMLGFITGLFGMATAAKLHDTVAAVDASELWKAILDFIRKRLGV